MKLGEIFNLDLTPSGKYIIKVKTQKLPAGIMRSSYAVLEARVMGLEWAQYLRMCRDLYGAQLIGKKSVYPSIYFQNQEKALELVQELNARAAMCVIGEE